MACGVLAEGLGGLAGTTCPLGIGREGREGRAGTTIPADGVVTLPALVGLEIEADPLEAEETEETPPFEGEIRLRAPRPSLET